VCLRLRRGLSCCKRASGVCVCVGAVCDVLVDVYVAERGAWDEGGLSCCDGWMVYA